MNCARRMSKAAPKVVAVPENRSAARKGYMANPQQIIVRLPSFTIQNVDCHMRGLSRLKFNRFSTLLLLIASLAVVARAQIDCGDFTTLQACHDALPKSGGKLILPRGVHSLSKEWKITRSRVVIEGQGRGNTVLERRGIRFTESLVQIDGKHVTLTRMTLDGKGEATNKSLLNISGAASFVLVHDVEIMGNGHNGLGISGDDVTIRNNVLTGMASPTQGLSGIWCAATSIDRVLIDGNRISGQRLGALQCVGRDVSIINNTTVRLTTH